MTEAIKTITKTVLLISIAITVVVAVLIFILWGTRFSLVLLGAWAASMVNFVLLGYGVAKVFEPHGLLLGVLIFFARLALYFVAGWFMISDINSAIAFAGGFMSVIIGVIVGVIIENRKEESDEC
ncbi:MAG: hypothetical protein MJ145_03685 [Clostridia bacterium]|nr:hypothetical protein [Clostridia bacterium]